MMVAVDFWVRLEPFLKTGSRVMADGSGGRSEEQEVGYVGDVLD